MRSVNRYKIEEKTPRKPRLAHGGLGMDSDASSTRQAHKKSKAERSTKDVSDEESADNSEFSDDAIRHHSWNFEQFRSGNN